MPSRRPRALSALAATLLLAACEQQPVQPVPVVEAAEHTLRGVTCNVDVRSQHVVCDQPSAAPAEVRRSVTVGGQDRYVTLSSSNIAYDPTAEELTFDATITNLLPQPLGTTDGTTPDPDGVRIFFQAGPTATAGTGAVAVVPDSVGDFTGSSQAYYQYAGPLATNETSAPRQWKLQVPRSVDSFDFTVFVDAEVPRPLGYVDLGADSLLLGRDSTLALSPVVRRFTGETDSQAAAVSFASADTTIATVSAAGLVTVRGYGFTTITATSGGRIGQVTVGGCAAPALGEAVLLSATNTTCVLGTEASTEYVYMPVNLSVASTLSFGALGQGIQAVTGPPTPTRLPTPLHLSASAPAPAQGGGWAGASFASSSRRLGPGTARRTVTAGVPAVGDLWSLNVAPVCSGTPDMRTAQVRSVGQRIVILADTTNPAGGFTTAQYDSIALEFDSLSWNVVTSNFGQPTDRDANGRVVAFFTRAYNELTPPAAPVTSYGEFRVQDVKPASSCPLSNEGEIIYMMVPDPTGAVNSNVRTVSAVRGSGQRTLGHEFQHLVNASRRLQAGAPLEEPWLDEGLSLIAEELLFYRTAPGLAARQNIILSNLNTGPSASRRVAAYNTYQNSNFTNLRTWLQRPDTTGAFKVSGTRGSAARGAIWAFLRYAADRNNGDDAAFWSSLVESGLTGQANLRNAIGAEPSAWLRDWVVAMYADDAVTGAAPEYGTASWNFRSVYGGLGGFPLLARPLFSGNRVSLSYATGGSAAYFRFGVAAAGRAVISGTVTAGDASASQVVLMRTK